MDAERPLYKINASVMMYNEEEKQWIHAGSNNQTSPYSEIHILQNTARKSYRIVGLKCDDASDVTVNMNIMHKLKYHVATSTFHQWRCEKRQVYGINFSSPEEAENFKNCMTRVLDDLNNQHQQQMAQQQAQQQIQNLQQQQQQQQQQQLKQEQPKSTLSVHPIHQNQLNHIMNNKNVSQKLPNHNEIGDIMNNQSQYRRYQEMNSQNHNNLPAASRPQIPEVKQTQITFQDEMMQELDRIQDYEMESAQRASGMRPIKQNSSGNVPSYQEHMEVTNKGPQNQSPPSGPPRAGPPPGGPPAAPPPPGPPPMMSNNISLQEQIRTQKSKTLQNQDTANSRTNNINSNTMQKPPNPMANNNGGDFLSELTRKLKKKSDTTEPNLSELIRSDGDTINSNLHSKPSVNSIERKFVPDGQAALQSPQSVGKQYNDAQATTTNSNNNNNMIRPNLNTYSTNNNNNNNNSPRLRDHSANNMKTAVEEKINKHINGHVNNLNDDKSQNLDFEQMKKELRQEIVQDLRSIIREELNSFLIKLAEP